MERRKTRLSVIGISLILILSVIVAVFGVTNATTIKQGNSVSTDVINQGVDTVAATDSSKYIGGVDEYYMDDNSSTLSAYEPIANATQLRQFLLGQGNYANKNGKLTADIAGFHWNDLTGNGVTSTNGDFCGGLSPRVTLNRKLDGCGHTIEFAELDSSNNPTGGTPYSWAADNVSAWTGNGAPTTYVQTYANTNSAGYIVQVADDTSYSYTAFGGMVAALLDGGELRNFTFKIRTNHTFIHDGWNAYGSVKHKTVVGGLVGYQAQGSSVSNVAVEFADGVILGSAHTQNAVPDQSYSDCIVGGITGVSEGGSMTNVKTALGNGSMLVASSYTIKNLTGAASNPRTGRSYIGGIIGQAKDSPSTSRATNIQKALFVNNGGTIRALLAKTGSGNANAGQSTQLASGIAAYNDNSTITGAMVKGNMNCLQFDNDGYIPGSNDGNVVMRKNIFVAEGNAPTSMIYFNATGGDNGGGNRQDKDGYYTVSSDIIYVSNNEIEGYFAKENSAYLNFQLFIPENRVLWQYNDQQLYSQVISGKTEDDARRVMQVPNASTLSGSPKTLFISIGTIVPGKLGFYMRDTNSNIEDENGVSWTEVSDQVRIDSEGNTTPLYYNGTSYEIKILANFGNEGDAPLLHDSGLTIRARGDLTNARSAYNGRPVTLYTRDSQLAYKDEEKRIMVMLDKLDEGDLDKTLTIDKRYLGVTTTAVRGVTGIFDKATVTFEPIEGMDNTGLAGNDRIKWQDTSFEPDSNGITTIDLNVAGRQMLRPSTNNYNLMLKKGDGKDIDNYEEIGSYFATEIVAHTIEVDADVYINGEAIKPYQTRAEDGSQYGIYEVKNARTDKATYNDTKRKLVVTVRVNDNHFKAARVRFYDAEGNEVTTYRPTIGATSKNTINWETEDKTGVSNKDTWKDYDGLITTTIWINDDEIRSIRLEGRTEETYSVTKNIDGVEIEKDDTYSYGQRTTLTAPKFKDNNTRVFVGWQRAKDGTFISYLPNYSLKIVEDFNVNAVYADYDENDETLWKQEYYGKYGRLLRERYVSEDSYTQPDEYSLKESAGFIHRGVWTYEAADVDTANKVIKFHASFSAKDNRPMVNIIWIDSPEHRDDEIAVDYGQPIVLKGGNSYLINNALIECDEDYTIYALTDMNIVENPTYTGDAVATSMDYTSFDYKENGVGDYAETEKYFLAVTFIYGKADAVYDNDSNKPEIMLDGFDDNDYTEYVRRGNVYQISMVISKQEFECRFGPDSEITTTLQIVKEGGATEQIGGIIIFRRKSTDTTGQGTRVS